MKHLSVILRALIYTFMSSCIVISAKFNDEGAAKLMDYKWGDWLVLWFAVGASVFTTLNAYFDLSFGAHMLNGGGPEKPALNADDFRKAMADWNKQGLPTAPTETKPPVV